MILEIGDELGYVIGEELGPESQIEENLISDWEEWFESWIIATSLGKMGGLDGGEMKGNFSS